METRFFISNLHKGVRKLARDAGALRDREPLHWTRDVAFSEDACSIWQDRAPENQPMLRKIALDLLRQKKRRKRGLKAKSKMAS